MPELRCTVQTCQHNRDYYCDLDKIEVGGNSAKYAGETCCDSFVKRKDGMDFYSDAAMSPSAESSIDCKATDCIYNEACHCHAGKISVEGGGACQCEETECATFKCGCA